MREKILAQLKAKFSGVSHKALGLIADKLAKKVTEESGIEQAITDFDNAISIKDFADDLQREGDTRVGDAKKEWEKNNPKPPAATPPKHDDQPKPDEVPAWAKTLTDQIASLTRERNQGTIAGKAKDLLKDVPAEFWNGRTLPEKEEDLQTFVEAVTKDYNALTQSLVNKGLMSATPPAGGGGNGPAAAGQANNKQLDADIKDWADKGKPAETKK